jgi:hypothetical protein
LKIESRNTIAIISTIGIAFGVSITLFFTFGLSAALYFAIFGIPLAFALGIAIYIMKMKNHGGGTETALRRFKVKELEKVIDRFRGLQERILAIEKALDMYEPILRDEFENVETQLRSMGCGINEKGELLRGDYNFKLLDQTESPKINKLGEDIGQIELRFRDLFHRAIKEKDEGFIKKLEFLKSYGFNIESQISQLHALSNKEVSKDLNSLIGLINDITEYFEDALNVSLSEAFKLVGATALFGINVSDIRNDLNLASENKTRKNYDMMVSLLQKSMDRLKVSLQTIFAAQKEDLLEAFDEILKNIDESMSERAQMEELKKKVIQEVSPLKLPWLLEASEKLLNVSRAIVVNVYEEIRRNGNEMAVFTPPEYFWNPQMIPDDMFQQLCSEREINHFAVLFSSVYKSFKSRADYDSLKLRILRSFSKKIEQRISKKLEEKGTVSVAELGVAQPEEFLRLYASYHPETNYDEGTKILLFPQGKVK